ncbi:MAG TPA: efflux RND transporter periplasmic adaptor subunit [Terriglobales bacterium]|nr:efflux RND transporter periplasmic adaptor subunit [Terriglobales bacterium]
MMVLRSIRCRLFVAATAAMFLVTACSKEEVKAPPPRSVRVVKIQLEEAGIGGHASGVIQSRYNAQVGFLVSGRLIERKADIGMVVKKGDVLAQIDPTDFKNKLTAAQSQVTSAQSEIAQAAPQEARLRKLLADGFTTQADYDKALRTLNVSQADLQQANANLRLAQDQVKYTTLVADTDGAITQTGADPGQVVNAGQMIVQISQLDAREAVFALSERAITFASRIQVVHVALQSDPTITTEGTIREISPTADPVTGTYTVKVALPEPPDAMRLGAVVTGSVDLKGDEVAIIPTSALLQSAKEPAVWLVSPDQGGAVVHMKPVKVERFDTDTVTISQGLQNGDMVVTAGINWLADGQQVALPEGAGQ